MANTTETYKVLVNGFLFYFTQAEVAAVDIVKKSSTTFHLVKDHRSVNARIIESDSTGKKQKIELDGETFEIEIRDEFEQVLEKMGLGTATNKQVKEIKAPMPGLVLEIGIVDGQEVKDGDRILILEAMKMENNIMIHVDAKIKKVIVSAGQAVEKGQVLVELE
jgi:biotin carboxyl carrier protein